MGGCLFPVYGSFFGIGDIFPKRLVGSAWYFLINKGCGVIQPKILETAERNNKGWALGLGLERFAMLLFNITDIRMFWSEDHRYFLLKNH